jgi:tRNA splicing ligase
LVVDLINLGKERDEIIDFLKKKMVENTDIYFAYMSAKTLIKLREMPLPPSHEDVI